MQIATIFAIVGIATVTLAVPSNSGHSNELTGVLSKLMDFYYESPNVTAGLFDQSISPWWESGSISEVGCSALLLLRYSGRELSIRLSRLIWTTRNIPAQINSQKLLAKPWSSILMMSLMISLVQIIHMFRQLLGDGMMMFNGKILGFSA